MAKVKKPLIKPENSPLVFSKRKDVANRYTHNVRTKNIKSKKSKSHENLQKNMVE